MLMRCRRAHHSMCQLLKTYVTPCRPADVTGQVSAFSTSVGCTEKCDIGEGALPIGDREWLLRPTEALLDSLCHSVAMQQASGGPSPIGQPIYETHPHTLGPGEITHGTSKQEYQRRRRMLASVVREKHRLDDRAPLFLFVSATGTKTMANDIPYPFRQETNFLYLTGLHEPDAVLMIVIDAKKERSVFFVMPKDPNRELWDGPLSGLAAAVDHFGADEAYPLSSLAKVVREKCSKESPAGIWVDPPHSQPQGPVERMIASLVADGPNSIPHALPVRGDIELLRLVKSDAEIQLMKRSCQVACNAFSRAMRSTRVGLEESILQVVLQYECRIQGAQRLAFPPVVAGGRAANTLHYTSNAQILKDGDLVLVDAGCEYHGYTSDVSRTWPVNGKFTTAQRLLYELVLAVQLTCIEAATVGTTLNALHTLMLKELGAKLKSHGVVAHNSSEANLAYIASSFCPHHVGHYLGMDTHDTPSVSRQLTLRHGMVITVEPGLYIGAEEQRVPSQFRGVGIRIEDNVLITRDGPVVLTANCPKTLEDIEEIMRMTS